MINLADTARLQGRLDEARKLAEEADALNRRTLGPEHPQTLFGLTILSSIARDQGRLDEARKGYEKALAALRRTLSARTPEVQRCMADYAWMLAATTDPGYRDPHRAIELANELIQNSPKVRDVWTTLGVAHYRAGAWNDAIAALEKSEAAAPGLFTAANGFFLAMAYWRLGEKEKGREWYAKALQSVETASQPTGRELALFRLEASRLLGISDPTRSSGPEPITPARSAGPIQARPHQRAAPPPGPHPPPIRPAADESRLQRTSPRSPVRGASAPRSAATQTFGALEAQPRQLAGGDCAPGPRAETSQENNP